MQCYTGEHPLTMLNSFERSFGMPNNGMQPDKLLRYAPQFAADAGR